MKETVNLSFSHAYVVFCGTQRNVASSCALLFVSSPQKKSRCCCRSGSQIKFMRLRSRFLWEIWIFMRSETWRPLSFFLIFHKCIFIRVSESWILGIYRDLILLILQESFLLCYLLSILTVNVLKFTFFSSWYTVIAWLTYLSVSLNLLQDPVSISVLPIH